jgi:uncharacterized membrane protein YbjE (DUF340 family)
LNRFSFPPTRLLVTRHTELSLFREFQKSHPATTKNGFPDLCWYLMQSIKAAAVVIVSHIIGVYLTDRDNKATVNEARFILFIFAVCFKLPTLLIRQT